MRAQLMDDSIASAELAGLTYVSDSDPGFSRQQRGEDTVHVSVNGRVLSSSKKNERIEGLKIPPAWTKVWICEDRKGHLQVTGVDKKGRKQYIYHTLWTKLRSEAKFDKMVEFGHTLPVIRRQYDLDLQVEGNPKQMMMPRERMLAALVRLLDTTFIRIGNETYRKENQHFGLTTLLDDHCTFEYDDNVLPEEEKWYDGQLVGWFTFVGKSGKNHTVMVHDENYPDLVALMIESYNLKAEGTNDLFVYVDEGGTPRDIKSRMVNDYLQNIAGSRYSAKDFRTWRGTEMAASGLAKTPKRLNKKERKKRVTKVVKEVADRLGNTPAVCRSSYIHPLFLDDYMAGRFHRKWKQAHSPEETELLSSDEIAVLNYLSEGA